MPSTVLVADDDAGLRSFLAEMLEDEGYLVFQASDGRAALERVREHPTGLVVLLDLIMPRVTGLEVLWTVDADPDLCARHAFLLMSSLADTLPPEVVQLLERRQIPLFTKPFDPAALLAAVAEAVARLGDGPRPEPTHGPPPRAGTLAS